MSAFLSRVFGGAPPPPPPPPAFAAVAPSLALAALAGSALGFVRPVWFISVGYGLACIFQVAVAGRALAASGGVTGAARCGVAAFAAHGAWMALFLAARDYGLTTYRQKRADIDRKAAGLTLLNKAVMWVSVAALYVALFVPSWALAAGSSAPPPPGSLADRVTRAGAVAAWLGLWLEVTADICKAVDKWRNPGGFSSGCVYRICRQPNLLGEAIFWAGTAAAGAPALAASPLLALVAAAGVAAIVSILVGDSAKKTEDQGRRMAGVAGWRAYARTTPPLWPLPRSGPA